MKLRFTMFAACCLSAGHAAPQVPDAATVRSYLQTHSVADVSPIFGQVLRIQLPAGYNSVFEDTHGEHYIREHVPTGESVDSWSRMVTVTGFRDLASKPAVTPRSFASSIAAGFQRACQPSFSAQAIGEGQIDGADMFALVASCGISPTKNGNRSETALIVALKGSSDYYTIQWAERGAPSATPLAIDAAYWREKYQQLLPIKLCARVAGEATPYPSCLNKH